VPWRNERVARAGTVHLDGGFEELSTYTTDLANRQLPRRPFVLAGQMTTTDPNRSPAGTESMWAYTHVPHRDDWDHDEAEAHANAVEAIIEQHAPASAP
jgi:phytoene dehydrogenase-like protein